MQSTSKMSNTEDSRAPSLIPSGVSEVSAKIAPVNMRDPRLLVQYQESIGRQFNLCTVPYMLANIEGSCNLDSLLFGYCYPKAIRRVLFEKLDILAEKVNSSTSAQTKLEEKQFSYVKKIRSDFAGASKIFESNAHKQTCPTIKLQLYASRLVDEDGYYQYAGKMYADSSMYDEIFSILEIPFINTNFDTLNDFATHLGALALDGNTLVAVKLTSLETCFGNTEYKFNFRSFYTTCAGSGYHVRTLFVGVFGDDNKPGHRMVYSSCTEVSDKNLDLDDTRWLFYDAQGRNMYMQGDYESTIDGFFRVEKKGIGVTYDGKDLYNDKLIAFMVKSTKANELRENEAKLPVAPITAENEEINMDLLRRLLYVLP